MFCEDITAFSRTLKFQSISTVSQFHKEEPISDRHFHYLSTLSRNSRNGFELSRPYDMVRILSSNPFLLFPDFTWRRIGQPISDRHFHYLSTLSRNIRNGFELRKWIQIRSLLHFGMKSFFYQQKDNLNRRSILLNYIGKEWIKSVVLSKYQRFRYRY